MDGLRGRWETGEGRELADEAIARLVAGRPLAGLGLGTTDGRLDLRGLPAPVPRWLRRFEAAGWFAGKLGELVEFQGAQLEGLDLSGAQLRSLRFRDSRIAGCRFDGTDCRDWRLWGTEVSDCSFAKASLREAAVGTWHDGRRNSWRRVAFQGADFRVGVSWMARYGDCDFSGAKLTNVKLEQCALARCRFAGELHEVVFDGRDLPERPAPPPMTDVDFTDAVFDQVEFMGFDLAGVILPRDPDVRLIRRYRCVIERALAALDADESLPARMLRGEFTNRLKMMRGCEESNVFNRRDYLASGGEELADLAERVLGAAEGECLPTG